VSHEPQRSHRMGFIARHRLATTTFTDAIALEAIEVASDETFRSDLDTSKGKAYSAD